MSKTCQFKNYPQKLSVREGKRNSFYFFKRKGRNLHSPKEPKKLKDYESVKKNYVFKKKNCSAILYYQFRFSIAVPLGSKDKKFSQKTLTVTYRSVIRISED